MNSSLNQFNSLISDTRQMTSVYSHFNSNLLDDLLRWQWTQAVSALDKYIHDVIRVGLIKSFNNKINPTDSYFNLQIPLSVFENADNVEISFEQFIIQKLSYNSYQTPTKINEGLSLIWNENHKWQTIANCIGKDQRFVKNKLNLIAQRRNQIVHQGDYPSTNLEKDNILLTEVQDVIEFIEEIVNAIHQELIKDFTLREINHDYDI